MLCYVPCDCRIRRFNRFYSLYFHTESEINSYVEVQQVLITHWFMKTCKGKENTVQV